MPKEDSLSERILDAAQVALRRYGTEKTNVVDIARALDMSHGNIYRHFPSKKALLDAVALRWLHTLVQPLEVIASDCTRPASERLTLWFNSLRKAKRKKLRDDPELFRMHLYVAEHAPELVGEHLATLLDQVERMIAAGTKAGEFSAQLNPQSAARAFLLMTAPFHHPALVMQGPPPTDAEARMVMELVLAGLLGAA